MRKTSTQMNVKHDCRRYWHKHCVMDPLPYSSAPPLTRTYTHTFELFINQSNFLLSWLLIIPFYLLLLLLLLLLLQNKWDPLRCSLIELFTILSSCKCQAKCLILSCRAGIRVLGWNRKQSVSVLFGTCIACLKQHGIKCATVPSLCVCHCDCVITATHHMMNNAKGRGWRQ